MGLAVDSEDDIIRRADGSLDILCTRWAGGSTYNLCPTSALRLAKETLPAVKGLGFHTWPQMWFTKKEFK